MTKAKPRMNKGWLFVTLTCIMELVWVYGFHAATAPLHFVLVAAVIAVDFYFLFRACELLPTGTVYAIFAAAGTAGAALMDLLLFGGSLSFAKLGFMALLLSGVILLKLADGKDDSSR
ncbi:DMT family transporter [Paenibacillus pasadenensis]